MIMGTISLFISYSISFSLPNLGATVLQNAFFWQFIIAPVTAMIPILAFYLTYGVWFKNLNGWRVLPWLYVIGTFGFMGSTGNSHPIVTKLIGLEAADLYVLISLFSWFVALFIIRKFIVAKSGHVK